MEEKYNDINIFQTVAEEESYIEIFNKFIQSIGNNSYNVYRNIIDKKKDIDEYIFNKLNDKIKDEWFIDVEILYNINSFDQKKSLTIFLDLLDSLHFKLKDLIVYLLVHFDFNENNIMENIEFIVSKSNGKLRSLLKILDLDSIYNIVQKCFKVYENEIRNLIILNQK